MKKQPIFILPPALIHLSTILFHRDALFLSACLEGNDLIVREGLSKGVDPNCSDGEGVTGLMKAITRGENQVGTNHNIPNKIISTSSKVVELANISSNPNHS